MNSTNKKKTKRIHRKPYDVLKIDLGDGTHSYMHVAVNSLNIFYDWKGSEELSLEEIVDLPIAFRVAVYRDVITSGRWPRIGNIKNEVLDRDPYQYKQDMISGALAIYHDDFADTNYQRPATLSEVEGLECCAVWDWGNVEERLHDHFGENTGHWIRELAIDVSKIPEHQRK